MTKPMMMMVTMITITLIEPLIRKPTKELCHISDKDVATLQVFASNQFPIAIVRNFVLCCL